MGPLEPQQSGQATFLIGGQKSEGSWGSVVLHINTSNDYILVSIEVNGLTCFSGVDV
jgi:hypothetical protein